MTGLVSEAHAEVHVTAGWWACARCAFRRWFATREGAIQGAAKHLREEHLVRLMLPARLPWWTFRGWPVTKQAWREARSMPPPEAFAGRPHGTRRTRQASTRPFQSPRSSSGSIGLP